MLKSHCGIEILVDEEFLDELSKKKWYLNKDGYACCKINENNKKQTLRIHRLITQAPNGLQVDHINCNKLDNRLVNLRICNNSQNQINRSKPKGINRSSQYKGVSFLPKRKLWRARINYHCKNIDIGCFDNEQEAAIAYNKKAKELFGEFSWLNVINAPKD